MVTESPSTAMRTVPGGLARSNSRSRIPSEFVRIRIPCSSAANDGFISYRRSRLAE